MEFPTTTAAMGSLVLLVILLSGSWAQEIPSCAEKLVPCASFMNVTSPPPSCCDPLKDAITNQLTCLCGLYNSPGFFKSLNINETDALSLPTRCKLSNDLTACSKASSPTGSASKPPPPPGTPRNDGNVLGAAVLSYWTVLLLSSAMIFLFSI
ncbi:non-specific lipid transfer protein GPI-anchored 7-like [Impatiens glandulifera]|uniref:non-specific lipid transfer protein GPI-anchored 7-like n=1 Tax=Impatiens glandulifera TaxID=253017 RepID=UPI001FB18D1D|nr:non-specific lipid transfer protein GPI-anchored 7-like [Impatiens glandulifera]